MKRKELRGEAEAVNQLLAARVTALQSREAQLAQQLREIVSQRSAVRVEERLKKILLAEVDRSGQSIRSNILRQAGLVTLFDAYRMRNQLERIPGIGGVTAGRVRSIIAQAATVTPEDSRFYSDPSSWNVNDYAFVGTLIKLERIRQAKANSDVAERAAELVKISSDLKGKTGVVAFLSRPNRESAESLYDRMRRVASPDERATIANGLDRILAVAANDVQESNMSSTQIVAIWRASSAGLLALAEQIAPTYQGVSGQPSGVAANPLGQPLGSPGLLPSTIQERITSFKLNTAGFKQQLRGYQHFGARFILCAEGAILGDEMGLGKTMQALAVAHHITQEKPNARILVIAPVSILENWRRETEAATNLKTFILYGSERELRTRQWEASGGIAMTSYQTLRRLPLQTDLPLDLTIVDEAHKIKNSEALQTEAAYQCLARSRYRLLLSGTPLENRTREFMFLLWMVNRQLGEGLVQQFGDGSSAHLQAASFRRAVAPSYLRRNQSDVLQELPELLLNNEMVVLDPNEVGQYRNSLAQGNHASARQAVSIGAGVDSSKMERLSELLDEYRSTGEKVLIFSSFLKVLDVVGQVVGGQPFRLDGSVPTTQRQRVLDEFSAAPEFAVLVMQIDVGGTGLNIQSASAIVIVEPQWKPSTESQAIGRAYRMGQTRRVSVHRLLAADTIDERIEERLQSKTRIFNAIVRPSELAQTMSDATSVEINDKTMSSLVEIESKRLGLAS